MEILGEIQMEKDLILWLLLVVVDIFTTDGINFSAKSANEPGYSLERYKAKLNKKIINI